MLSVTPISSTASGPLVSDPAAVGQGRGSNLIPLVSAGTAVFAPGQQATTQVVVRVVNPDLTAVYDANAIATAASVANDVPVSDLSDDVPQFGTADPGNDIGVPGPGQNPNDPTDPQNTATPLLFSPLQLFKRITSVTRNGVVTSFNNVVNGAPSSVVGEVDVTGSFQLSPGDTVEYTIYYFNLSSATPLTTIELCDVVPSPLAIINTSLTSAPAVPGTVLPPLLPLSSASNPGYSCLAPDGTRSSGTQGAVVFSVGDIAADGSGLIRFSATVE